MKRFNLCMAAWALALIAVPPAYAADMPGGYRPAYVAPAAGWSGFYAGLNGAYGWGQSNWSGGATGSNSPAGGLFGATLGFNVQSGAFVFGAEGDLDGNWMRDSNSTGTGFCSSPGCGIQTSWYATTRGRIGYAFDRALFYGTAGAAFGDLQMMTNGGSVTADRVGWTAGVGLEYAFLGPWSAKIEYLYADLGSATCGAAVCGTNTAVTFTTNIIRLGVNYRFW
jgi:outer membrane immunogenic protein